MNTLATMTTSLGDMKLVAAAHLEEHPLSLLAKFNQQFGGYLTAEVVGDYGVFFTGLKSHQNDQILVGQWFGWPGRWLDTVDRVPAKARYFYAAVPAGAQENGSDCREYKRGEILAGHRTLYLESIDTPEGRREVQAIVMFGRSRLLNALLRAGVITYEQHVQAIGRVEAAVD